MKNWKNFTFLTFAFLFVFAASALAQRPATFSVNKGNTAAAVDYFLKIEGVPGESTDDKHKNEIDVLSWSWGMSNSSRQPIPSVPKRKSDLKDFVLTVDYEKASPKLMLACANGTHIPQVTLTCRKAGNRGSEYYIISMKNVLISSYQSSGSAAGDVVPVDQLSLNFEAIKFEYAPQRGNKRTIFQGRK